MRTEPEYRRGKLTLFSLWLGQRPSEREQTIVHEFVHNLTHHQRQVARDIIFRYTDRDKKPDQKNHLFELLRRANEAETEDITLMLKRLGYWK